MAANWYLVRFMPDLRRREPRNVGVVLYTPEGWLCKFAGQRPDGSVDGRRLRRLGVSPEVYRTWVDYFSRKARAGRWEDVERLQAKRRGNYFAEPGGVLLEDASSWESALLQLFDELVEEGAIVQLEPAAEARPRSVATSALRIMNAAGVEPQENKRITVRYGSRSSRVSFRFAYTNGQPHLMDVANKRTTPRLAAADARELKTRFEAAREAGAAQSFYAFYSSDVFEDAVLEDVLMPLWEVAQTVDVTKEKDAIQQMATIAHGSPASSS